MLPKYNLCEGTNKVDLNFRVHVELGLQLYFPCDRTDPATLWQHMSLTTRSPLCVSRSFHASKYMLACRSQHSNTFLSNSIRYSALIHTDIFANNIKLSMPSIFRISCEITLIEAAYTKCSCHLRYIYFPLTIFARKFVSRKCFRNCHIFYKRTLLMIRELNYICKNRW